MCAHFLLADASLRMRSRVGRSIITHTTTNRIYADFFFSVGRGPGFATGLSDAWDKYYLSEFTGTTGQVLPNRSRAGSYTFVYKVQGWQQSVQFSLRAQLTIKKIDKLNCFLNHSYQLTNNLVRNNKFLAVVAS